MRLKLNPAKEELIKKMLRSGMRVGEIQVMFPNISTETIRSIRKKIGLDTGQDKKETEKRDLQAIKEIIQQGIKDEIITETSRLENFLYLIDREIRKKGTATNLKDRIKAKPNTYINLYYLNTSSSDIENYNNER